MQPNRPVAETSCGLTGSTPQGWQTAEFYPCDRVVAWCCTWFAVQSTRCLYFRPVGWAVDKMLWVQLQH